MFMLRKTFTWFTCHDMYLQHVIVLFVSMQAIVLSTRAIPLVQSLECDTYDYQRCNETGQQCNGTMTCKPDMPHCFSSWKNNTNGVLTLLIKGCWTDHPTCYNKTECIVNGIEPRQDKEVLFCCCDSNFCNHKYKMGDVKKYLPTTTGSDVSVVVEDPNLLVNTFVYTLVPLTAFTIVVAVAFCLWRRHKFIYNESVPLEEHGLASELPQAELRPIQLIEVKATGRFGAVWKAHMLEKIIAVKIFPIQDKQSWIQEQEIFELPQMNHSNILRYIGVEKRGANLNTEFWLLTEFHENGSLYDYLKGNLISWSDLCKISESMARGLAFLHDDSPATITECYKPAIAHRDFKSRNVLLKSDLTVCLADFGLAMRFEAGRGTGDTHGQVGTRRYMAPEVLEGAINFNRDAFMRIDMYACGLVLWEIASRCSVVDGPVENYQLPFEEEVGSHPTLEDMQETVVQKRIRPKFKEHWLKHPGIAAFCETIEECWDHDAEARLSAGCIEERIAILTKTINTATSQNNLDQGQIDDVGQENEFNEFTETTPLNLPPNVTFDSGVSESSTCSLEIPEIVQHVDSPC